MFAPQPWPQGSTITNPHAALSPQPFSDEFLLMLLEPETQRPKSYWMTMVGCLMASQIEGARWIEDHPNFYIRKVTCQPQGKVAQT